MDKVVRVVLPEKVTFEQRPRGEGVSYAKIWRNSIPGRRNSTNRKTPKLAEGKKS